LCYHELKVVKKECKEKNIILQTNKKIEGEGECLEGKLNKNIKEKEDCQLSFGACIAGKEEKKRNPTYKQKYRNLERKRGKKERHTEDKEQQSFEPHMTDSTVMASNDDDEPILNISTDNSVNNNRRCPTCQGTGLVTTSPGLVALIPLDDVRLKRRHTFLWIVLTIILCTVIASIVIATILPRSVHLSIENPVVIDATDDSFRNTTCFRLTFIHQTNIQSDNWVPIHLINLTTSIEHQLVPIGPNAQKIYSDKMYLRPLGTIESNVTVHLDFNPSTMAFRVCQGIFRQMLMFKLQTTLTYADFLLGRIQTTNNISYQYVLCNRGEWKLYENMTATVS
jgi:hypothetical protein